MTNPLEDTNTKSVESLSLLGVSVHHLQTTFLALIRDAGLDANSNVHRIENLQGPPGVIRRRGKNVVCPVDGKIGAAYVHCLEGEDHVGLATQMLSYCWSYKIGDIVDSLSDYCKTNNLDPKRTYIWICCLCINQHRVVEQKECGGTGMMNFEEEFPRKLKRIGHMLAMMAPWQAPFYLTRLWCVFEMYAAHANGCKVDIVMPPQEKQSLEQDIIEQGGGIDALYKTLGSTNVQNADATVPSDKTTIMKMIDSTVGCQVLNNKVNECLRSWMKKVLIELPDTNEDDERRGNYHVWIGNVLYCNGEFDAALEQYKRCLAVRKAEMGNSHLVTATAHNNIGLILTKKGDHDGALEQYRECLAIRESALGDDHPDTATTYNNIGSVLDDKGDLDGALKQYEKCLVIREAALGKDHSRTASTHSNIANVLDKRGDHDGALEKYRKCLAIQEAVLGKDHPRTATTRNNIGNMMNKKGRWDDALEQYKKCLVVQEVCLGQAILILQIHATTSAMCWIKKVIMMVP